MATASAQKTTRLDLRATPALRERIERAAELRGMTITQWVTGNLTEDARRDIEGETVTWLEGSLFDEFSAALDSPLSERARTFLASGDRWTR